MTKRGKVSALSLFFCLTQFLGPICQAYENEYTHPLITDKAITLLSPDAKGSFKEVRLYHDRLALGSHDEDIPDTRGAFHFYNPKTGAGLHIINIRIRGHIT